MAEEEKTNQVKETETENTRYKPRWMLGILIIILVLVAVYLGCLTYKSEPEAPAQVVEQEMINPDEQINMEDLEQLEESTDSGLATDSASSEEEE